MDIKKRIQELSLDQKAKLYYMMLLRKGVIDTLPEDPKAAYVQSMMDEPASSKFSEPMGDDPRTKLKERASELGYLKEIDLNAVSYEKVTFIYTEQGGRFYGLDVYENKDQPQRSAKLRYDEANEWLKDTLHYIHEGDLIPKSYNSGLEDLDLIVARLKELGIEASHGDYMDVS
jgi:hypothetical protein